MGKIKDLQNKKKAAKIYRWDRNSKCGFCVSACKGECAENRQSEDQWLFEDVLCRHGYFMSSHVDLV